MAEVITYPGTSTFPGADLFPGWIEGEPPEPPGGGVTADEIAHSYMTPYQVGQPVSSSRLQADLFLLSSEYDLDTDQTLLKVCSDEAMAVLLCQVGAHPIVFGSLSVRTVVGQALGHIGAVLSAGPADAQLDEVASWEPTSTLWDFLEPLTTSHSLRLFCDEHRTWQLVPIDDSTPGLVTLSDQVTLAQARSVVDLNGEWADSVVVEYQWQDAATGSTLTKVDYASVATPHVTAVYRYPNTKWPGAGAAAVILKRQQLKGRTAPVTAVADYSTRPGMDVTVHTTELFQQAGQVLKVTFNSPSWLMDLDTYGLESISPDSTQSIPATYQTDQLPGTTASLDPDSM